MTDWLATAKQHEIVDIGQIPKPERVALDLAAKRGEIAKWRGYWNPWGIGSHKTWFGPLLTPAAGGTNGV